MQFVSGLFYPVSLSNPDWYPLTSYLQNEKIILPFSSDYRFLEDGWGYLESARNFPEELGKRFTVNRPLYPFFIFLASLPFSFFGSPSPGLIFSLAIAINLVLLCLASILFYSLLKNLFSSRVALLSSFLFIFSPFVHTLLVQPLAEILMAFLAVIFACFIYDYFKKPSLLKLITYSLIVGILLLGKVFFAFSLFVVFLALYFRRYKEGAIFTIVHLIPLALWYLLVTRIWQIPYQTAEVGHWGMGVWILEILSSPRLETAKAFLRSVPYFLTALFYGFFIIPVVFSFFGLQRFPFRSRKIIYFCSIVSVFILGFVANVYAYRHAFLVFPVIYPAAVLGMERAGAFFGKDKKWLRSLFLAVIIGVLVFASNINFSKIFGFNYYGLVHWTQWPLPGFLENIFKSLNGY